MTITDLISARGLHKVNDPPSQFNPEFFPSELLNGIEISADINVFSDREDTVWVAINHSRQDFLILDSNRSRFRGLLDEDYDDLDGFS